MEKNRIMDAGGIGRKIRVLAGGFILFALSLSKGVKNE